MCRFNTFCQNPDGNCMCYRANDCPNIIQPIPVPFVSSNGNSLIPVLFKMIFQQNEVLKSIAEQSKRALNLINKFTEGTSDQNLMGNSVTSDEVITAKALEKFICGEDAKHTHFLQFVSEVPNPAYKERAFSLLLQIVDSEGNKAMLPEATGFKVMLFTTENPPKLMKINTNGDNILKGTIETQGNCNVMFRKIAIKEVSSHFRGGCFFFVIAPKDASYIKPLIIENFIVKARKIPTDIGLPRKKCKLEEELY